MAAAVMALPAVSQPPPHRADFVGRVLAGRYRLVELLAEGGMAMVYRATVDGTAREVAVKIMRPELARDPSFAKRFQREARMAGRLSHPRIVRVLDHGEDGAVFFLVMELLDGEDLFDILARERTLDEVVARRVVVEVCEALSEAHGLGIVHRDLKLENVFIARGPFGELGVKVLDFGVAKMREPEGRTSSDSMAVLTAIGTLLGTPEYMSPEACRGETPGPGGDVYACGVLLYVLLTGRPPFTAKNAIQVTLLTLNEAPVAPSVHRPGLDPAFEAVVLRALAKDPAGRPASAAAMADALRAVGPTPALTDAAISVRRRAARERVTDPAPAPAPTLEQADLAPSVAPPEPEPAPALAQVPAPPEPAALARPGAAWQRAWLVLAALALLLAGLALGRHGIPLCR
jgi:serine/threonine-protein kinase